MRKTNEVTQIQGNPFKAGDKVRVRKECIDRFPGMCDGKVFEVKKIYTEKIYKETVKLKDFNEFHYSWFELAKEDHETDSNKPRYRSKRH